MKTMAFIAAVAISLLATGIARGQTHETPWQYSVSVSYYDVPNSQDFWNPIVTVDHGRLHLEARYNYVGYDTFSLWAGANFSAGTKWRFDATVLFGIVGGSVEGVAPGYELSLSRAWFSWTSQGDYLFDTEDDDGNFFYNWMEATGSPATWCRLGVALQRTKMYETNDDVQRGLVAAFTYKSFEFEVDALDPNREDETYIVSVTYSF
jgi:hypothetical protein